MPKARLTTRQLEVYCYMKDFFLENDQLPPLQTMQDKFGWKNENGGRHHREALAAKGYLELNAVGKYRFKREASA